MKKHSQARYHIVGLSFKIIVPEILFIDGITANDHEFFLTNV